jgi:ATP-binding cassette subfamily F protein 3
MLTIRDLTMSYGGRMLFEEAELTINWGERVALVGPNGAGKSTLFQIILGNETADSGKVERDEYAHVGYLSQEAGDPGDDTALQIATAITPEMRAVQRTMRKHEASGTLDSKEYAEAQDKFTLMNGFQLEPKAKKILAGLGFRQEDFDRTARELSGGWVMRAHLAQILCLEPDLLMLDEPTNHLDLLSLLWFQRYLQNYPGAILMISHDRDFMDSIAESVVEIDEHRLISYQGNYSHYVKEREAHYKKKVAAYRNQKKEIDRVQEFIDRFRSVSSKASQVQSRVKQLEKMKTLPKPKAPRKIFKFHFPSPPRSNQKVIELEKVSQAYGATRVYESLDLEVERGDRIVLVGPNGAGKSTLLKILAAVVPIDGGERRVGYATKLGYYSQHRSEVLEESKTVLEEICTTGAGLREEDARGLLGSFLFRREDVHKRVGVLSGGEKSRLNLVKFLVDPPNLLLMDEPTTHLDLLSVEALIQALKHYEGSLVFISHDVHFIRKLAKTTWHSAVGVVTKFSGGYDYYLEKSGLMDDERGAVTA